MNGTIIVDENKKADFSMPYEFPIRVYETDLREKTYGFNNWHWHDEFQFCVVTSGCVHMTVLDSEYCIQTGEGIFINTGCVHMSRPKQNCPAQYLCLNIHPNMLTFFHGSVMEQKYFLPFIQNKKIQAVAFKPSLEWQRQIIDLQFEIFSQMSKKDTGYELEVYIQVLRLWKLLILNTEVLDTSAAPSLRYKEVKQIMTYIHEHYDRRISLEEIAAQIHMSKSGCCRIFKQMLNCTITDYLTEYRMQKSMELLENTDLSVTQTAYESGFSSVSYFIKKFRETIHMTPGEYREKLGR
ncbi:helix-turn-helix domain-containing protein [Blautia schinkii]|nr:helix-turn-helix domain-containing protein [Blautia schinkii]